MTDLPPLFDALDLDVAVLPGFPDVHETYRLLRDQKDMVCGAYALTYLLRAYGVNEVDGDPVTIDRVAEIAGTTLEPHNADRQALIEDRIATGELPSERAATWYMHDYFDGDFGVVEDEGGTSAEGLVEACETASGGRVEAIPVPAVRDAEIQLDAARFDALLGAMATGAVPAQPILNYNLRHTLAPAGLLGHKYNVVALLAQWDDPSYFRTMDWDVGHFTTVAARVARAGSDERYLVVRDSYKTFGWDGYHLQPESYVRRGLVRADDHRDGGVLLVTPAADTVRTWLADHGLEPGLWDNGSAYTTGTHD
ncbi:hypothetical protein HUG10_07600 [Halorarum halophilum]|uniref:Peptidase C39-like domain-containing protein n=1 Tax=Halorarum halophilum TaxID=2743090 RepID=A0A7D5KUG1_9EURY|nr:hypothetical protein [Halobaculum halophilum]QLG27420.1 hypothetical protein HUG10_07600 [Halobaculum halophilum]